YRTLFRFRYADPHFLISLLIICMMLALGVLFASCGGPYQHSKNQHGNNQSGITEGNTPPLPTPDSARTTYTNAQYGYSIRYPTQWYFTSSDDNSFVRVFLKHDLSVPEAVA